MVPNKSLDEVEVIAALICDVQTLHGDAFSIRNCRLTCKKLRKRVASEGSGFLTKTLPRLGKAFDKALTGYQQLNATSLGLAAQKGSQLPRFLGELFNCVLNPDGTVLQDPCIRSIISIRQILYLFYKYELPFTDTQEHNVIRAFVNAESDVTNKSLELERFALLLDDYSKQTRRKELPLNTLDVAREARISLQRLFRDFDGTDITPSHGPGVVSTKEKLWEKYEWTNVSPRITEQYPFDAYFCASLGHFCDRLPSFLKNVGSKENSARVVLVPKDSRGPRLISCEPVDFQWIQQGLSRAIVRHVEGHELTKFNVFFTNQVPNQKGALLGSISGKYATLDLNEASDRVSLGLVRLLFPEPLLSQLLACRSLSTELPDGKKVQLQKYAPMGSALCFPVLALTVWSLLRAGAPDEDTRESILVYGDDVIVPTTYVANAMRILESFGLKINRDKSCTSGFFRESCGVDAYRGIEVTPVRLRTVWSSSPSAESYTSWISYANDMYDKKYFKVYDLIVAALFRVYGKVPEKSMNLSCPSLKEVPDEMRPSIKRWNSALQKTEYLVRVLKSPRITHSMDGWSMLLRYFCETQRQSSVKRSTFTDSFLDNEESVFSVRMYTRRRTSMLVRRWR
jgi:hypothetical protein